MQDFRITRIADRTYSILDAGDSSFYVVEGDERAAVIDTGITPGGSIMPIVRKLTDKPVILLLTHAHIDHMHHMDEFDEVYMSHKEFSMAPESLEEMMAGKQLRLENTLPISTGSVINLGDESLEVCEVGGHTPGSVAFYAKNRDLLFTGDAIGSGYGVWMQTPDSLPLEEYLDNLRAFLRWLVERGGRMRFWGGHSYQQFQSTLILHYNPVNLGLLCDLIDLVDGLVKGTIVGRASNADKIMSLTPALYASFGRAEIQYRPENIRRKDNKQSAQEQ